MARRRRQPADSAGVQASRRHDLLFGEPPAHPRVLRFDRMTHARLASLDRSKTVVIATLSPLEVHGPHLPLGQDLFEAWLLARAVAERVADRLPDWHLLLLPPVPVATDCVPQLGSVQFPAGLVRKVAYHLLEPFAREGFARLAYSSFHGGPRHVCALEAAADDLRKRYRTPAASLFSVVLAQVLEGSVFDDAVAGQPDRTITLERLRMDQHAGFVETAIALAFWPGLVDEGWRGLPGCVPQAASGDGRKNDSYLYRYPGDSRTIDKARQGLATVATIAKAIGHFRTQTYYGFPAEASAGQGRALFEHLAGIAAGAAFEFVERGDDMPVHSPLWKFRGALLNPLANRAVDSLLDRHPHQGR